MLKRLVEGLFCAFLVLANTALAESNTYHEFNHKIDHPKEDYRSPTQECFLGGMRGALIGLGAGAAYHLISYGATGKADGHNGRIVATTVGLGFLVGAVHGYISADNENDRIRKHEDNIMEKYGRITPEIFTGMSLASTSYGLTYRLSL